MAVTAGEGHSRVIQKRHYDNYESLKQYYRGKNFEEVIIHGYSTSGGGAAEISFCDNIIDYAAAAGQAYIRTEQDDVAIQGEKYVYLQYQTTTGLVKAWVTADLNDADTTTEVAIGSTDFYRARQMYSEVESSANDAIILCDADWGGVDDTYAEITDTHTEFALERFFTQPDTTHKSFLGKIEAWAPIQDGDSAAAGFLIEIKCTPKPNNQGAEVATAADKTFHFDFSEHFVWEPCLELDGGTEVFFYIGDYDSPAVIAIEATMLEILK